VAELKEFRLPDVGEGLTEADILRWYVQPGDKVTVNQNIVEIETAKAAVELPCPYDGVVAALLVPEGETVDVGTPIIAVAVGEGAVNGAGAPAGPGAAGAPGAPEPVVTPPVPRGPTSTDLVPPPPRSAGSAGIAPDEEAGDGHASVLVGYGVKPSATSRRRRKTTAMVTRTAAAAPAATSATSGTVPPALVTARPAAGPADAPDTAADGPAAAVLAKPPVRKLAKDLGVDLSLLAGTGPGGSITRDDVQSAGGGQEPAATVTAASPAGAAAREERIAIRGVRKHTAEAMVGSAFTAPHVTEFLQVDVTETMNAVARLRDLPEFAQARVSPLLLVARALLVAVARHPMVNSSWDEAAQEIVVRHYVNLGIAVATDRGLIVPNIKDAQAMPLPALASALAGLTQTARAGKATPADLRGGTITITNVGVFGVDAGTPILTPGETAILAFGQVRDAPWVHQGQLAVRKVTTLSLSFDHRIVDGDLGSAVLRDIGAMLEDPLRVLAWS
jgi:2-oxoisovalerate dehydrogenase E2 component (dihydrolipoyl transacylase)